MRKQKKNQKAHRKRILLLFIATPISFPDQPQWIQMGLSRDYCRSSTFEKVRTRVWAEPKKKTESDLFVWGRTNPTEGDNWGSNSSGVRIQRSGERFNEKLEELSLPSVEEPHKSSAQKKKRIRGCRKLSWFSSVHVFFSARAGSLDTVMSYQETTKVDVCNTSLRV